MALIYSTTRKIRADIEDLIKVLLNPNLFLKQCKYVESVEKSGDIWMITFKWRKFGMTRHYDVDFRVYRDGNTVVYESDEGSPNKAKIIFTVVRLPTKGFVDLTITAEFDVGGLASFLGRGDFGKFVEELADRTVKAYMKKLLENKSVEKVDCRDCMFYEAERKYCYALDEAVEDPTKPPCKGSMFKKPMPEAAEEQETSEAKESASEGKESTSEGSENKEKQK